MKQFEQLFKQLGYVLLVIVIFRLGTHIPIYGINTDLLIAFDDNFNKLLSSLNMFTGGALSKASIFSLAVMPYISASIFIQLGASVLPYLKSLKEQGREGQAAMARLTRILTIGIGIVQGYYLTNHLLSSYGQFEGFLTVSVTQFYLYGILSLVVGSAFLVWCAEQVTERGIGNGVSLIIYIGIASSLPNLIKDFNRFLTSETYSIAFLIMISLVMLSIVYIVVYIENIQKRLSIHLTGIKSQKTHMQDQYLPFKINLTGVMPVIIAGMFISLPLTVLSFISSFFPNWADLTLINLFGQGKPYYYLFMGSLILFFTFFYMKITNQVENVLNLIKNRNIIIDKIRPGKSTENFIRLTIAKLGIIGSFYLFLLTIIPDLFIFQVGLSFYFGGTALLIMVLTSIDWIKQLKSHFEYKKYSKVENKLNSILD